MAQVRDILEDVKKIDTIETNVSQLQTDLSNFDALPDQSGHVGQYLQTDGTSASWVTVDVSGDIAAAVANLVDSAPTTLDTLNELAAALGDDPNFATTVTNSIATKQDTLVSGTNIKTVGGTSLLGSGDISLAVDWNNIQNIPDNLLNKETYTATAGQTDFNIVYTVGAVDVYLNGIRLTEGVDFTAVNGTTITLTDPAAAGDIVDLVAASAITTYVNTNLYTKSEVDTLLANIDALPDQTSQAGNYLTTDGTTASWASIPPGYTDSDVATYLAANDYDTATNIIASITDSAPATLDTLNELAAALGDDANFSTTVTNSLAGKADLTGATFTGTVTTKGFTETQVTKTSSFTPSFAEGTIFNCSGTMTITMPAATAGKSFTIIHTTGTSITWSGSSLKWSDGSAPTAGSGIDIYTFISDGSNWYGMQAGTNFA